MATIRKRTYQKRRVDGSVVVHKTSKYYGYLHGQPIALCTDRQASETMLREMKTRQERGAAGLIEPRELNRPIKSHLDDYKADLELHGRDDDYVRTVSLNLAALVDECDWTTIRSITADSIATWKAKASPDRSARTINLMAATASTFCNWAIKRGRLYENPLTGVEKVSGELKRQRRAMTVEEIGRLLDAAGPRRLIYWTALESGLRRGELAALQWGDVRLDNVPAPFIQLRAVATKSRRGDTLPLRSELADALCAIRPGNWRATDRVFSSIPKIEVFYRDLDAAKIPRKDAEKRRADFHALRHSFCSHLAAVGVNPRAAMGLMRHTDPRLTMNTYTDDALLPLREALEKLPSFTPKANLQEARQFAEGTHGRALGNLRGDVGKKGVNPASRGTDKRAPDSFVSGTPDNTCHAMAFHGADTEKTPRVGLEPTT